MTVNASVASSCVTARGAGLLATLIAAVGLVAACDLAPIDLRAAKPLPLRSTIHAADGSLLARLYRQNRVFAPIEAVPDRLVDAVLAAEDARFFEHPGYDLRAIARAAIVNARAGQIVQGGSTITQQYVKNVYFRNPARTLERKARELRLAVEMEDLYSKDEILERYLNTVYFGNGAYGVKAAAQSFFGHGLRRLSVRESALLAAVIKSPALYDPRSHPQRARYRRNYIIDRMGDLEMIGHRRMRTAKREGLGILRRPPRIRTVEPYFVEAVRREVLSDRRLGRSDGERAKALYKGGLRIETTLDPGLQDAARSAINTVLNQPSDPSAALVAIKPATGEIVAMIGGANWNTSQVNLALGAEGGGSGRQPGSSFKPIVLAAALEVGGHLERKYQSAPAVFRFDDATTWTVRNAEGNGYGKMSLEEATIHSVNGVFARLGIELGADMIASQAELMGVRSDLDSYPSISLGAMDVSVLDMAAAYATLANQGTAIEPTTIESIELPNGSILRPQQEEVRSAVAPGNAYLITHVLQQVIERGTGTAAAITRPAAGKTGTTNNYTDAWFVGYTPDLVAAVWVGHARGLLPMTSVHGIRVFGGTFPAQIWRQFMIEAHRGIPITDFRYPKGDLATVEIDPASELLAAPWCSGEEWTMLTVRVPTEHCPEPSPNTEKSAIEEEERGPKSESGKEDDRDRESSGEGRGHEEDKPPRDANAHSGEAPSPAPSPTTVDPPGD
jgi:penicillin-binding protein 1A